MVAATGGGRSGLPARQTDGAADGRRGGRRSCETAEGPSPAVLL